jgi:hypothetical protein
MNELAVIFPANQFAPPVGASKEIGDLKSDRFQEEEAGVAASLSQQHYHFKE